MAAAHGASRPPRPAPRLQPWHRSRRPRCLVHALPAGTRVRNQSSAAWIRDDGSAALAPPARSAPAAGARAGCRASRRRRPWRPASTWARSCWPARKPRRGSRPRRRKQPQRRTASCARTSAGARPVSGPTATGAGCSSCAVRSANAMVWALRENARQSAQRPRWASSSADSSSESSPSARSEAQARGALARWDQAFHHPYRRRPRAEG